MRKTLLLLAISLFYACTTKHSYFDDFNLDRNAFLEVKIINVSTPFEFELYSRHIFPSQEVKQQSNINQDTVLIISIPSNIYDISFIKIGNEAFMDIYTIPDDTLQILLNLDNEISQEQRITFKGSSSSICQYFEAKRKNWMKTKGYDYYYDSTISVQRFTDKMDRNRDNDLKFLLEYSSQYNLPEWFIETEKNSIIYTTAAYKIGIVDYHKRFYNPDFQTPDNYYSFTDEVKINNPGACLSSGYYAYLSSLYGRDSKVVASGFKSQLQRCIETLTLIESGDFDLDPKIEDLLLGSRLSILYLDKNLTHHKFQQSDSILQISEEFFHNKEFFLIIKKYRDAQFEKLVTQTILNPGDTAPSFTLVDRSGKLIRLSDFSGNVVYLNFWATYCSPCIASIPDKNLLVKEFSDQSFKLINICLDFKPELWSSIIEEQNFAGTHFICKGNWSKVLRENYLVHTIPHYTLIDEDGKIISNNCEKPGDIKEKLKLILN